MTTIRIIQLIFMLMAGGWADVSRRVALMSEPEDANVLEVYLASLRRLGLFIIFLPIIILILGMIGSFSVDGVRIQANAIHLLGWTNPATQFGPWVINFKPWAISVAGMFLALATLGLFFIATPLALLVGALQRTLDSIKKEGFVKAIGTATDVEKTGKPYVNFFLKILLIELIFTAFVMIVPIDNHIQAVPIMIILSIILGLLGGGLFGRKLITAIAGFLFVFFTLSCFFPQSFQVVKNSREKIDQLLSGILSGKKSSSKTERSYTVQSMAQASSPEWKVCWQGGEANRIGSSVQCFPAEVKLETNKIEVSYPSWKNGSMTGNLDSNGFSGEWRQSNGDGFFFLKSVSPTYLEGWWNDPDGNGPQHLKLWLQKV